MLIGNLKQVGGVELFV